MIRKQTKDLMFIEYDRGFAAECHENFLCQKETAKFMLWKPTVTPEEAERKLNYWTQNLKAGDIFCLIKEQKSQKVIGFLCAYEIKPNVYGEIGIAIGSEFVKKGYGSQVLAALIEAVKSRGAKEIHYSHLQDNEASKQLALKFGFEFYKKDKRLRKHDQKLFDELFYVLKI